MPSFETNFAYTTSLMAHCHPSIRGQVRQLFPSVRLSLPFFVGDRYSSSLQVCFQLWNLPVFKIFFLFRQTSHNFPYICCIFKASFSALASHSCERAHSFQGHRGIQISSIARAFIGIHLIPKWPPLWYSIVYLQFGPRCLV